MTLRGPQVQDKHTTQRIAVQQFKLFDVGHMKVAPGVSVDLFHTVGRRGGRNHFGGTTSVYDAYVRKDGRFSDLRTLLTSSSPGCSKRWAAILSSKTATCHQCTGPASNDMCSGPRIKS